MRAEVYHATPDPKPINYLYSFEIRTNGMRPKNRKSVPYRMVVLFASSVDHAERRFNELYRRYDWEKIHNIRNCTKGMT